MNFLESNSRFATCRAVTARCSAFLCIGQATCPYGNFTGEKFRITNDQSVTREATHRTPLFFLIQGANRANNNKATVKNL